MRIWLKVAIGVFILGFLGFLAFAFLRGKQEQAPVRLTRADGVIVTIEGVTFGTNHVFYHGSKLLGRVQKYLPNVLQKWLGAPSQTSQMTSEPVLLIWYSLFDPATVSYPNPNQESFEIIDDHGCVFRINQYGSGTSTPSFAVHYAYVQIFPRRQKTFTFRAKFSNTPALDFAIANPAYSAVKQEWKPETLPIVREFGGTNFALTSVKGHFYKSGNSFESKFRITSDGKDLTDWFAPSVTYADITGNSGYSICPHEPGWKVQAIFYNSHKAPFTEEIIRRISDVKAPEPGEVVSLQADYSIGTIRVRPIALCGPGDYHFSNAVNVAAAPWESSWGGESSSVSSSGTVTQHWFRKKHPVLLAQVSGLGRSKELMVRAVDEKGRFFSGAFSSSAGDMYLYELRQLTNSARFSLEFIPQQPFSAEYFVEPPRPKK